VTDVCYEVEIKTLRFIEGHAKLVLKCINGVYRAEFQPVEGPRLVTLALRGKRVLDAPHIVSRICGICFSAHTLASVKAIEEAYNYKPNRGLELLRQIVYLLNHIQSNIVHLTLQSIPPLLGFYDNAKFRSNHIFKLGVTIMKKVTSAIEEIGKTIFHTPLFTPFGIGLRINGREVYRVVSRLVESVIRYLDEYVTRVISIDVPLFVRVRPLLTLNTNNYPKYESTSSLLYVDSSGERRIIGKNEILDTIEYKRRGSSTGLQVRLYGKDVTVGALSRILNYKSKLCSEAREKTELIQWDYNPFLNNHAQAVELISDIYKLLDYANEVRDYTIEGEDKPLSIDYGTSVSIVEAPRGVLVHYVKIRSDRMVDYKVITPTAINAHSIERDAEELANKLSILGREKLKNLVEDLVRAYDPCLSCSVSLDPYTES